MLAMPIKEDITSGFKRLIPNQRNFAERSGVSQSTISRFKDGNLGAEPLLTALDTLGAKVVFPDQDGSPREPVMDDLLERQIEKQNDLISGMHRELRLRDNLIESQKENIATLKLLIKQMNAALPNGHQLKDVDKKPAQLEEDYSRYGFSEFKVQDEPAPYGPDKK